MRLLATASLLLTLGVTASGSPIPEIVIADNFEVDSSASYVVRDDGNSPSGDGTPDGGVDFTFDYIAAGIPLAPNSAGTDTLGLRMVANETSSDAGAPDHISAFHLTSVSAPEYTLSVDIYMGVDTGASGSTEFSQVGIGSDGTDFNSIFTPIAGDGHFLAMTGDGGSASDYRHFVEGTPVNSGDPSYLNSDSTTNASGDTYQSIFPGGDFPGSPGNRWTTMTITVTPSDVVYALDGTPVVSTANADSDGLVSLSYIDVFSSVGPHFVVYDNLSVAVIPEPASATLMLVLSAGLLAARRR